MLDVIFLELLFEFFLDVSVRVNFEFCVFGIGVGVGYRFDVLSGE